MKRLKPLQKSELETKQHHIYKQKLREVLLEEQKREEKEYKKDFDDGLFDDRYRNDD